MVPTKVRFGARGDRLYIKRMEHVEIEHSENDYHARRAFAVLKVSINIGNLGVVNPTDSHATAHMNSE